VASTVRKEAEMRIYEKSLDLVGSVVRLSRRVQEQDGDLARQMRRACISIPLNLQEVAPGEAWEEEA
jgi:four helix bundle protein